MIRVENLTRKYGNFTALNAISFEIKSNCITALLGPNGAGKTTTLRILCGYLSPTAGEISIFSKKLREENLREIKNLIGYVPENNPVYDDLEVVEYLLWVGEVLGLEGNELKEKVKSAINRCSLKSVIGKKIGTLSKGYKQRLALAKAILNDPPILILDEPTAGLDPNQAEETRNLIKEIRKDKTVIISTHILSEVEAMCDEMIIINKGNIVAAGTKDEIVKKHIDSEILVVKFLDNNNYKEIFSTLNGIKEVQEMQEGQEKVYLLKSEKDLRVDFSEFIRKKNLPVLEFYRKTITLDEIFRKITSGT